MQQVKIDLLATVHKSVEFNYYSALFSPTVTEMDGRGMVIRLLRNDISSLLSPDMECRAVFPDKEARRVVIRDIRPDNGWLELRCSLVKPQARKEVSA